MRGQWTITHQCQCANCGAWFSYPTSGEPNIERAKQHARDVGWRAVKVLGWLCRNCYPVVKHVGRGVTQAEGAL